MCSPAQICRGGIKSPTISLATGHGARAHTSKSPVRDASEDSVTSSPPSARTIHSPTHRWRTARSAPATLRWSHMIFDIDGLELRRTPAARWKSMRSTRSRRVSTSPRGSNQARAGAQGRPVASSSTPVSAMPVTPTPSTSTGPRRLTRSSVTAWAHTAIVVSASDLGSMSQWAPSRRQGVVRAAEASTSPARVTATAFTEVVPTSTPMRTCRLMAPLCRFRAPFATRCRR
ncbi:unannotated protein [freshwater metagenome]|uniref:Unannotated protein n=1 Tax=freshwater metagenome TaxID=449393 RepID=A0A6J7DR75_9ZZZZ